MTFDTQLSIVPSLTIHPDAAHDIRQLMTSDRLAAGKVIALLQQAKADPKVIESLLDHDFGAGQTAPYHVSKWFGFWNTGYNIWRLKIWVAPKGSLRHRIVYAYEPRSLHYHILAVVHRDFDYQLDHDTTRRIIKAYRDLGIAIH